MVDNLEAQNRIDKINTYCHKDRSTFLRKKDHGISMIPLNIYLRYYISSICRKRDYRNRYDGKRQDDNRRIDFSLIDSGYCNNNRLNNNRLNNNSMKIIIVHPFRMTRSTNHGSSVSLKERKRTNQRLEISIFSSSTTTALISSQSLLGSGLLVYNGFIICFANQSLFIICFLIRNRGASNANFL